MQSHRISAIAILALSLASAVQAGPIENLLPGSWYEVPNSNLRAVAPNPTPSGNIANCIRAWSGGTYDTVQDRLLVFGGGGADYGGNEIYGFSANTLTWSRVWGPTDVTLIQQARDTGNNNCQETYADGRPVSRHSYDGIEFLPGLNRFWFSGGAKFPCDRAASDTWTFDFGGSAGWERKADFPISCSGCTSLEIVTGYDKVTGHVFLVAPGYNFHEYSPTANTWTVRSNSTIGYGMNAAMDTKRRKLVVMGNGQFYIYDVSTSGMITRQSPSTSGATSILSPRYPGVAYDPVSDRMVAWSGGADVYTLNMDTLVWTRHTTTGTVIPTQPPGQGTYGRFQYIPSKNAFIVVNSVDENVYIYKLSPGGGTPGDTVPPSPPTNLIPR